VQEELADGLHLIDFEQLKIENQTYNEKIEERNEVQQQQQQAASDNGIRFALSSTLRTQNWLISFFADTAETYYIPLCPKCLQCFDTIGWAAGRASGL